MGKNELTKSQYTGVDYQTAIDDLRNRLAVEFKDLFNDFSVSDMAFLLLDSIAYAQDSLAFYQDQRANENYLSLAKTRNGISRIAKTLGYKPTPATPAAVDLNVSLQSVYAFAVPIPAKFQFTGEDNLIYEVAEEVVIPASSSTSEVFSVPLYQGQTFIESFISDGSANQSFLLSRIGSTQFIGGGSVVVKVNGSEWTEKEYLTYANTNQYEVDYYSVPPRVRFGNGVRGAIPPANASVQVEYIATDGVLGNVSDGRITQTVTPLVVSFQTIALTATNPLAAISGSNPESFDSIRANAPYVYATRNVAVTKSDYETLAGKYASPIYGRVAVAQAINTRTSSQDVYIQTQLTNIDDAVSSSETSITSEANTALAATSVLSSNLTTISDTSDDILTQNDSSVATLITGRTAVRTAKDNSLEVANDLAVISGYVTTGGTLRAMVDAIAVAGSSQLTSSDKSTILAYLDTINTQTVDATSLSAAISSGLDTAALAISSGITGAQTVGTTATLAGSLVEDIQTAETEGSSKVVIVNTQLNAIKTNIASTFTDVDGYTDNISDYFDLIYSDDCKSNVVTVPILSLGSDGFYAAPSNSLIRDTQTYLEGIKDVTHTVKVVSGSAYLLEAVLSIRIGVYNTFNQSTVSATVQNTVNGLLKNRKFGQSLYVSDVIDPIKALPGVGFVNVTIDGYYDSDGVTILTSKNDANGNLIVEDQYIITKGLVTITPETYIPV